MKNSSFTSAELKRHMQGLKKDLVWAPFVTLCSAGDFAQSFSLLSLLSLLSDTGSSLKLYSTFYFSNKDAHVSHCGLSASHNRQ